ncbi:MAG: TonB-dependent receptor [Chitinophagaceae bacterium]|nr:TonB-dependent receptor [Chitinophagaceae bacterium]
MQRLFMILILSGINLELMGQDISVKSINANISITWNNSFTAVTSINIQRSSDSNKNFITIGKVPVVKKGENNYIDNRAPAGKVFYRLFISFAGGGYLFTPSYSLQKENAVSHSKKDTVNTPVKNIIEDSIVAHKTDPASNVKQLKEVKVITKAQLVEQDIDKLIYHVEADPESKSMSALDMMRKIPLIIIDADDNIQVNGSTNFLVLVNGKRSSLFARSPKDVFKSMPAKAISNIEIITNPSSRYEAEGVGGIINVITNKKMVNGYNGSAIIIAGSPKSFSTSANLTVKTKRIGFSGYFGSNDLLSRTSSNFLRENINQKNTLKQVGESQANNLSRYFGTEFSYELDSLNLITANYSYNISKGNNNFRQLVKLFNATGNINEEYIYANSTETRWNGNDFGIDYQRNFKKNTEQLLTLSYQLNNSINKNPSYYTRQKANNIQSNYSDNNDHYTEHTAQADYLSSSKQQTLEAGVKSIFRINKSDYAYKTQLPGSSLYILDSSQSNKFDYRQSILAGYASITLKRKSFGLKAGVRVEETEVIAKFRSTRSIATQSYLNLIPNITLSQKLKGPGVIKLSYTQRIERPGLYFLNPFVDVSDPKNISYGNPKIHAAISNVLHLTYNTFISGSSVNLSLFHNFTNNSIQRFTKLGADSIARTTYDNIGKSQSTGISINGMTTLFEKLSLNINSTVTYVKFTGLINDSIQNNAGFVFNVFGYGSYRFNKGWRASGNVGYSSPNILLQGKASGYIWNSMSVQKDILQDNHASITLSVTSPFKKYRRFFTEVNDPEFYLRQEAFFIVRRFTVSYNYRFGKLEDDITRKKRGIKNDDLKTGESQGGRN